MFRMQIRYSLLICRLSSNNYRVFINNIARWKYSRDIFVMCNLLCTRAESDLIKKTFRFYLLLLGVWCATEFGQWKIGTSEGRMFLWICSFFLHFFESLSKLLNRKENAIVLVDLSYLEVAKFNCKGTQRLITVVWHSTIEKVVNWIIHINVTIIEDDPTVASRWMTKCLIICCVDFLKNILTIN